MLGDQRAQHLGLLAVEHPAAGRSLAALRDRHDHTVQRLNILLRRLHAREDIAQIDLHGFALVRRPKEFDLLQFAFERCKEGEELLFGRWRGFFRHGERQLRAAGELEPFVAHDHHGLCQVERGKRRIDRQGENSVGERDLVVFKPVALAAEHDGDGLATSDARRHLRRCLRRPHNRLGLVMGARRRGKDERAIPDGGFETVVKGRAVQDVIGADGHHAGPGIRPRLPRPDKTELRQPEIRHGTRCGADVFAELRLDQDHDRAGPFRPVLGPVCSRPWHRSSAKILTAI